MNEKQIISNEQINEPQIYTDIEASAYLKISKVTLWRLRKAKLISFRRVASRVVYTGEDLRNYLERSKNAALAEASA